MIRKLCNVNQLPDEGKLKAFRNESSALCVGVLEGVPFAVSNVCPHQSAPLSAGRLDGQYVVCPLHGWRWRITDGRASYSGDPDIPSYEVRQYGNEVFVRLPAEQAPSTNCNASSCNFDAAAKAD